MSSWSADQTYRYPYCAKDTSYYTNNIISYNYDDRGTYECPLWMHMGANYPVCYVNEGGFETPVIDDATDMGLTATETPTTVVYTQLEQDGDTTAIVVKECPWYTHHFDAASSTGRNNALDYCRVPDVGVCVSGVGDFCQNGESFYCPLGFTSDGGDGN